METRQQKKKKVDSNKECCVILDDFENISVALKSHRSRESTVVHLNARRGLEQNEPNSIEHRRREVKVVHLKDQLCLEQNQPNSSEQIQSSANDQNKSHQKLFKLIAGMKKEIVMLRRRVGWLERNTNNGNNVEAIDIEEDAAAEQIDIIDLNDEGSELDIAELGSFNIESIPVCPHMKI